MPIDSPWVISYSTSIDSICHQFRNMWRVFWWTWTVLVHGHRRSKVTVPIVNWSQLVVSYMTSTVSNIVFHTAFKIFDVQVLWPRSRTVQGHQRSWYQLTVQRWFDICLPLNPLWYLTERYLTLKLFFPRSSGKN